MCSVTAGARDGAHQISATRNGITRVSRGTVLFTFVGRRATDLVEMHSDLPGDDAVFT